MSWQPILMAVLLWILAGGAFLGALGPGGYDPRSRWRDPMRDSWSFSDFLGSISPNVEDVYNRGWLLLGGVALTAGGIFILVYYWGQ